MPGSRKAEIHKQTRLFDDFFQVDEVLVSHERKDGTMSPEQRRLVFERGDAVAIMLLNVDTQSVVMVNQFKVPSLIGRRRDDPKATDGWVTEATAGMIDPGETPEQAIIRETKEETGYRISNPQLISKFFSSPGGTSERIFLYFAKVHATDKTSEGGGLDDEDISVLEIPVRDLVQRLDEGLIDDPKLAIGAYWLKDYLKAAADRARLVDSMRMALDDLFARSAKGSINEPKLAAAARWLQEHLGTGGDKSPLQALAPRTGAPTAAASTGPLPFSTVSYELNARPGLIVGYKTGRIDDIKDVDIWVNSENTNMLMDRFIGTSISGRIRFLGANRDDDDNVIEDTIAEALRRAVGPRARVRIGTVLATESGNLRATNHVHRIFHVATVEAPTPGAPIRGSREHLPQCVRALLGHGERENKRTWRILLRGVLRLRDNESILIPMMGAGAGGLSLDDVAQLIIPAAIEHLRSVELPTLKEVYFLAFRSPDRDACERVLEQYCADGTLNRLDGKT